MSPSRQVPIAIVGMGALMPGATDVASFWRCLIEGQDLITDVPEGRWLIDDHYDADPFAPDRTYSRRGAFLPEVDFDPPAYGITPKAAAATDSTQMLALLVAEATLADIGDLGGLDRERVSVILGASQLPLAAHMANRLEHPVWRAALRRLGWPESQVTAACDAILEHYQPWQESSFPGLLSNVIAGRIANRLDLRGTNCTVDAACASSLAALAMGIDELSLGRADLVLTGGVDAANEPLVYLCFSKTPALSFSGDCRPFSADADGTMLGEGLAMFALARLADAEAAGMRVHAVIRGLGSSSDGRGGAIYAPVAAGQARALRQAYAGAGYGPETVQLVEAHGTGTVAGDAAEFEALRQVFDATGRQGRQWCALGSVKSQIGHTKCAAGAAGLLKAVLAVQHRVLPPTIKVERPDPQLDLAASPLYLNTTTRPWVASPDHPRRAAVSSFGFGGTNFHVTIEEYAGEQQARRHRAVPTELLLASGRSPEELRTRLAGDDLAELARRSQADFDPTEPARLAMVASSMSDLGAKLDRAIGLGDRSVSTPDGTHLAVGPATPGMVGFLFPGQGSQYVGMGTDLALHLAAAQTTWDVAAVDVAGLAAMVFPPPVFTVPEREEQERRLTRAEWAPPALAATSLVMLNILRLLGVRPDAVAGHSLGELVALHAAGVFDQRTLLRLARRRGELVGEAAGGVEGAMLAVLAAPSQIDLAGMNEVWFANYNGPAEVVLSGTVAGITSAQAILTARGLAVRHLNTATAFHSPIVAAAVTPLRHYLAGLGVSSPQIDVFGNIDAVPYPVEPDAIRDRLAAQVASPVRFADAIEAMHGAGIRTFVEVGAGSVLTGMVDRILAGAEHSAVALDRRGTNGLTRLQQALGQLAVLGVPLDFGALWDEPEPARPKPKPLVPIRIGGGVHGRAYPPPGGAAALPPANLEPRSSPAIFPARPPATIEPSAAMTSPPASPIAAREPSPARMTPPPALGVPLESARSAPEAAPALDLQLESARSALEAAPGEPSAVGGNGQGPERSIPDGDWLRTIEELHRQVAQAHEVYQRAMADGHVAFLKMAETSLAGLAGSYPGAIEASRSPAADLRSSSAVTANGWTPAPTSPAPVPGSDVGGAAAPKAVAVGELVVPASATDVVAMVLSIVADKTGYPLEVLGPEMDLETDLGIDSIKRVEILAAIRDELPDLEHLIDVGSEGAIELVKLRTVGEISDRLRDVLMSATAPGLSATAPHAAVIRRGQPPVNGAGPAVQPLNKEGERDAAWPSRAGELLDRRAFATGRANGSGATPDMVMTRRVVRTVASPPPGSPLPGFGTGMVTITDDGGGVSGALAERLRDQGIGAVVVSEMPPDARNVILLEGFGEVGCPEDAVALQRRAFRSARAVASGMESDGGLFVTVQDTGGDFGLGGIDADRAWLGGLAALARTAVREWPGAAVKAIDCERGDRDVTAVAHAIITELQTGGTTLDVGLAANGTRITLEDEDSPAMPAEPVLAENGVLVVTGGARGITAAAVRALAERVRPRLVLLGRTSLVPESDDVAGATDEAALLRLLARPGIAQIEAKAQAHAVLAGREVRRTMADLNDLGVEARYLEVDVTDRAALEAALDVVRRDLGPIDGIVHGAGVLADRRIADKTDAQFDAVFGTKVTGLQALLEATVTDPLRLIVGFGSIVARFGNAGQCDYAMANETMNQVLIAEALRRPGCLVRSLLWGPWAGGMVTDSLASFLRGAGVPVIPLAAGADAFCTELEAGPGPVPVLLAAATGLSMTVQLSERTHPELADHAPAGVPVLPVALVLDWFIGAARQWCPNEPKPVVRHLRVLRRVDLPGLAEGGHSLEMRGIRPVLTGADLLTLELYGDGSPLPHYRATVSSANDNDLQWSSPPDLTPVSPDYDGHVLFHGPRFRAVRTVDGVSTEGAAGTVVGAADLGWSGEGCHLDPAAVDGALQLAVLWVSGVLGGASLPMAVAECRLYRDGLVAGPVRCVVRGGRVRADAADCDVALLDPGGTAIVALLGVTLIRRPR